MKPMKYTREEAITAAQKVFASQEFGEYCKAWKAWAKAKEAYDKAWKACDKAREAYDNAWEAWAKVCEVCDKAWEAYDKARKALAKARKAYNKAWKAWAKVCEVCDKAMEVCAALIGDTVIIIPNEYRAFNLAAGDRKGVYCIVLTREEVWFYDGKKCPDPDTVEVVWRDRAKKVKGQIAMKQITVYVTSCADCPLVDVRDGKHYCTAIGGKGYCLVDFGIDIDPSCPFPTINPLPPINEGDQSLAL